MFYWTSKSVADPVDVVAHPGDDLDVEQEVLPVRIRHRTDTDVGGLPARDGRDLVCPPTEGKLPALPQCWLVRGLLHNSASCSSQLAPPSPHLWSRSQSCLAGHASWSPLPNTTAQGQYGLLQLWEAFSCRKQLVGGALRSQEYQHELLLYRLFMFSSIYNLKTERHIENTEARNSSSSFSSST